ncbi:hypothetical protein RchiOBHm_Chr1g0374331 [Rosa chinensis]|uniref:Uncharacterized protein n=1 Tax=Rosa chinensis TaxID=74649 RepID=A0A2P6SMA5_ROSCH|nr:hypothetical protein RchiOBHm_Chr1g0374331 [Rosa chinensis]
MEIRNKQANKTARFNEVRPISLPTSSESFTFTNERFTQVQDYTAQIYTQFEHSSLYPTRALVSNRIPLVHPLST